MHSLCLDQHSCVDLRTRSIPTCASHTICSIPAPSHTSCDEPIRRSLGTLYLIPKGYRYHLCFTIAQCFTIALESQHCQRRRCQPQLAEQYKEQIYHVVAGIGAADADAGPGRVAGTCCTSVLCCRVAAVCAPRPGQSTTGSARNNITNGNNHSRNRSNTAMLQCKCSTPSRPDPHP